MSFVFTNEEMKFQVGRSVISEQFGELDGKGWESLILAWSWILFYVPLPLVTYHAREITVEITWTWCVQRSINFRAP